MENIFVGFLPDSFAFFRELADNNNKAWFEQNRARYDRQVVGAFRGLLIALEPFLLELNPHFEIGGKTNRSFSRINRDIRFSKDKSPYKANFYLYVFDRRQERGEGGRLYVGLSADCLTVGFSIYGTWGRGPKGALETVFRRRMLAHRDLFNELLKNTVIKDRYETYWHREEKGEWAQHQGLPRHDEDWQTLHAWIVRKVFLPNARGLARPAFVRRVEEIFAQLYPLYLFTSMSSPRWKAEVVNQGLRGEPR
jgi:uncharacterized protein (TIGR02453 family)